MEESSQPNYDGGGPSILAVSKGEKKIGLDVSELAPTKKAHSDFPPEEVSGVDER